MNVRLLRAAVLLAVVALSACGKRGDPLPPIRPVPGRIADLVGRRVDDRVELRFTVPATNNDGSSPSLIDRVEIYRMMRTEDAASPSAVMLLNRKNLIGEITVRRPAPAEPQGASSKNKSTTPAAEPAKPETAPSAAPAGPGPGELAVYDDTTAFDGMPASAMRYYMLIGWAGKQQQRSAGLLAVSMEPTAPPKPVEDLAASFDEASIKVTWLGPPLLFLPVMHAGSPLPPSLMPLAARPAPGQLPIATLPKPTAMPATTVMPGGATSTPVVGAALGGTTTTPPTLDPAGAVPPVRSGTTTTTTTGTRGTTGTLGTTTNPSRGVGTTGAGGTTAPVTSLGQTGGTFGAGVPGVAPGMASPASGFGGATVNVGPTRGYRVTEVDESGHALTPNGPLAPVAPAAQFTLPVVFDKTRCFVVRTVDTKGSVIMESAASAPVCVTPKDTFPPAAPTELRAFGSETGVVLSWTGVDAPDLAGYVVLRGEGAGDNMQPLNTTPMTETTFSDTKVKSGVTYVYAVIAVDSSPQHNPSAQSNKQTIVAR